MANETRRKQRSYAIEEEQMDATACIAEAQEHFEIGIKLLKQAHRHSAQATTINLDGRREKVPA